MRDDVEIREREEEACSPNNVPLFYKSELQLKKV